MSEALMIAVLGGSGAAAVVSGITSVVLWLLNNKKAKNEHTEDIKSGLQTLLFYEIKRASLEHIAEGSIYAEDLEDLKRMHSVYHDKLDGNGYLDNIMHKVDKLPLKND